MTKVASTEEVQLAMVLNHFIIILQGCLENICRGSCDGIVQQQNT